MHIVQKVKKFTICIETGGLERHLGSFYLQVMEQDFQQVSYQLTRVPTLKQLAFSEFPQNSFVLHCPSSIASDRPFSSVHFCTGAVPREVAETRGLTEEFGFSLNTRYVPENG